MPTAAGDERAQLPSLIHIRMWFPPSSRMEGSSRPGPGIAANFLGRNRRGSLRQERVGRQQRLSPAARIAEWSLVLMTRQAEILPFRLLASQPRKLQPRPFGHRLPTLHQRIPVWEAFYFLTVPTKHLIVVETENE
jgi:hypothetical protein